MDDKLPKKNLDIQGILEKIKDLPIDDTDKATILQEIKNNITNPSHGENQNLDNIQSKYTKMNMPQGQYVKEQSNTLMPIISNMSNMSNMSNTPLEDKLNFHQRHQQFNPYQQQISNEGMPIGYNPNTSSPMTSVQFEILKNKLDSLQFELIDLLRHVKDYTQRYMNAIRQQDLDKINEYINALFDVDKKLKETQNLAETALPDETEEETEPDDRKSVITRATTGIKNFFGNIGNNVSGITDLVKNTADIANGYLTKKVLPSSTSNASNVSVTTTTNSGNTSSVSKNKNIVSVDEYINDMKKIEAMNNSNSSMSSMSSNQISKPISNANIISSSSNNINELGKNNNNKNNNNNNNKSPVKVENKTSVQNETSESNELNESNEKEDENLEGALKKLNDTINEDINNTVKISEQSGGKRTIRNIRNISHKEDNLTKKIRLLKLKLTKNNLQKQLNENKIISRKTKRKNTKHK